jgi:repressor LexA
MARPTIHTAVFARRLTEAMADAEYNTYTLAERLSLTPSTISRYMNGLMQPKMTTLQAMAGLLDVNPDWLMGQDAPRYRPERVLTLDNILLIDTKAAPLLGTIAAGEPIMAVEDCDSYIPCTADCGADFALRVKGDSMVGARILDGDIVFIRRQPTVEQGEIAAVLHGNEATLKRFKRYGDMVVLSAENPDYEDIVIPLDQSSDVRILGKAVAFQSKIR